MFEVEDPAQAADDAEQWVRQRRLEFWASCGARLLPVPGYVLPDYTGCGHTEPVLLMALCPSGRPAPLGGELRSLVLAIYAHRYGLPPDAPIVTRALASA